MKKAYLCIMVLNEITPLSGKDCFYIVERHKSEFLFPLHWHEEFELNFIENGRGVRRVVGDSIEEIGDFDLTLIAGSGLEHAWEQGSCVSGDIREITIQFPPDMLPEDMLTRNQFTSIREMLGRAERGLNFSMRSIMLVYPLLNELPAMPERFEQFLLFLKILYELSKADDARPLSSTSFAKVERESESRRVQKIKQFIGAHYASELRLEDLAGMVGMAPSAFSRFFKQHTGRTLVEYIIDIRLGNAARMLVDTTDSISEICYACGFNNLSNFNRSFKARRGYTPRDFRAVFKKHRVFV